MKDVDKNIEQVMIFSKATVKGSGDTAPNNMSANRPVIFEQEKNRLLFSELSPA